MILLLVLACDPAIDAGYVDHAVVESFSPASGRSTGGDPITILGRDLERIERIAIGDLPAEIVEQTERSLRVLSPPHAVGPATITAGDIEIGTFRYLPSRIQLAADELFPATGIIAAAGQFDRDPAADLAVLEQREVDTWGEATLMLGEPGSLKPAFEIPSFSPSPWDSELQPIDLDRDGLDDLILYTWSWYDSVHDINVMMNRGDGTFAGGQIADNLDLYDAEFFATDLDRDGRVDFGWMGATLMVFWGHGDGSFDPPETFPIWNFEGKRKKTLALSVVEDGLVGVNLDAHQMAHVRFLDHVPAIERTPVASTGTIAALIGTDLILVDDVAGRCPPGDDDPPFSRSAVGDVDGDGAPDLLGWSANDDGCLLFTSELHFGAVPHDGVGIAGMVIADFNADGFDDILRIEQSYFDDTLIRHRLFYGPALLRLPHQRGSVPLIAGGEAVTVIGDRIVTLDGTVLHQLEAPLANTHVGAMQDFTGDGTTDFLLLTDVYFDLHPTLITERGTAAIDGLYVGHTENEIAVWRDGTIVIGDRINPVKSTFDRPADCFTVDDFDRDGLPDLAKTCLNDRIELSLGLRDTTTIALDYWLWDKPHFTDVDDDGDTDLIGTGENGRIEIRLNEAGNFDTLVALDIGSEIEIQGTADLDGDGTREVLFYAGRLDLQFVRWRNERTLEGPYAIQDLAHHDPPWREPPIYAVDFPDEAGVRRHQDLDGDGLADLVMLTRSGPWPYSEGNIVVLRNVSW